MSRYEPNQSADVKPLEGPRYDSDRLHLFHWRHSPSQAGYGRDEADAFSRLGYGGGAIRALDWWEVVGAVSEASAQTTDADRKTNNNPSLSKPNQ